MSSWERPGRIDCQDSYFKNTLSKLIHNKLTVTPRPGRDDPCNSDLQRPGRISASLDIIISGLPSTRGGTTPPRNSPGPPLSIIKMRGTPEQIKTQLATLNAHPHGCSPGPRSRCSRSSRAGQATRWRWRRDCRSGRTPPRTPSPNALSACAPAAARNLLRPLPRRIRGERRMSKIP